MKPPIPHDELQKILAQHSAVLGKTGAGKSSLLRVLVEYLLHRKKRVVVIDPKGDWWGLKASADGKGPGFPVITFGAFKKADATDVPINEHSGAHLAELICSGNRPCVIGLAGWRQAHMTRFWIEFASTLFKLQAAEATSGELYLVGDEFHNFAPKGKVLSPEAGECLHWSNRLLSEGRGLGLTVLLASQRPQKVHNDTLTSCETLFAMRVIHKADREAYEAWIDGCGDPELGKKVLAEVAGMSRGEAFVWSPEAGFGPVRLQFPMFTTFDSFAPPQQQKKVLAKDWSTVDLDAVRTKLARVIEEQKANDPAELKRELAKLRADLVKAQKQPPAPATAPKVETKEVPVLSPELEQKIRDLWDMRSKMMSHLMGTLDVQRESMNALNRFKDRKPTLAVARPEVQRAISARPSAEQPRAEVAEIGDLKITATQQRILDALAWFDSIGTSNPTAMQIGAIALIDATGGHFSNTVGPLSTHGLIVRGNGTLALTPEGRGFARMPENLTTLADYHDMLRERVRRARSGSGKTVEILNVIIEAGGASIHTQLIGEAVGVDHTGGHFSNTIGPLGTLGLIERRNGIVTPTEILFPPALS